MWRLTWRGQTARYENHEVDLLRRLVEMCEAGEISQEELGNQVDVLHELKLEFDGFLEPEPPSRVASQTGLKTPGRLR